MTEIKRYEDEIYGPSNYDFEESEKGRWVKYEDHTAIVAEKDARIAALQEQMRALAAEVERFKDDYRNNPVLKRMGYPTTPATDAALREIRAQAVESFMSWSDSHIEEGDEYEKQLRDVSSACKVFAARIRAGEQP